ncbi:MAG: adenylate/guanylate cyclase domain-containing protein, partial [Melioribacteraceae bacterium]|nr:adenylate/guanylate cyclase domain-containing protein [Melioribacteraceae bacterium]
MTKSQFLKISFLVSFWVIDVIFYVFIEMAIESDLAINFQIKNYYYDFVRTLIIAVTSALAGGIIIASFEVLVFSKGLQKLQLGLILLIKSVFYLSLIFIFTSLGNIISHSYIYNKPLFDAQVLNQFKYYISGPKVWAIMAYWSFCVMIALFILSISEKLGQGVLLNYLLGKYHKPKEDTRIFMFLDLTSSSTYAEKLGHIRYSNLLQDCFFDLTDVVNEHNVQIYQYVGDEVVLTWQKSKGVAENRCIKTFFAFSKALKKRSAYYEKEYGIVPEFKAGINYGFVTIAEVGEMKKELAYHGDAINTAS